MAMYNRATIANGQSLSGVVSLSVRRLCWIGMPAAWTAASITFQGSHDGETWFNVYKDGVELTLTADAGQAVVVNPADLIGFKYLKIRSGSGAVPVAQAAERDLVLGVIP